MTHFLSNCEIYASVVCSLVPQARERLWIATAAIKDMYVDTGGATFVAIRWCECSQSDRLIKF
jgi:hypothetical protein